MTLIPLASGSDPGKSDLVTKERLVNLYAEPSPQGARGQFALYRTPGLSLYIPVSSDIGRGMVSLDDLDLLLSVHGQTIFKINPDKTYFSQTGTLSGSDDLIITRNMADPVQVGLCCTSGLFVWDATSETVTKVSDTGLTGFGAPNSVCTVKEYTIAAFDDGTMVSSDIGAMTSWDALNFATADARPDQLIRVYPYRDELLACGKTGIEFWGFDSSNTAFPFSPKQGAITDVGLIEKHAITDLGGALYWVDQFGAMQTLSQGYGSKKISNNGVDRAVSDYLAGGGEASGIKVFGYFEGGHQFIVVRASTFCWVYDAAIGKWAERQSYQRDTWQAKHYARFNDMHIVSRDIAGDLLKIDDESFAEAIDATNNDPLIWEVITPPVDAFPNGGVMDRLALDIETGTAIDSSGASQDQNPEFTEEHSLDGGKTWSTPRVVSLGSHAQYRKRVQINGLGRFNREGVMFRLRGSAAIRMAILRADLSARERAA